MTTAKASAPAKVNLTLHITGQRAGGYHTLESLVVFADVADQLSAVVAPDLSLTVSGPFAQGVPTDGSNLIIQAAQALQQARGVRDGAAMTLDKHLPHGAGIGSGSADAAAALNMLAQLWDVAPLPATAPEVLALGADVPVCVTAPRPARMSGIGEVLAPVPRLPACAMVMINPRVQVATADIFAGLQRRDNPPMDRIPDGAGFDDFAAWLGTQRNDMTQAAVAIAPEIDAALVKLRRMPLVKFAGMSGSGATCFGLVRNMADARQVARAIQVAEMGWWVVPAEVL